MTSWSDHAIWWHLHPLTFTGAEPVALPPGTPPVDRLGRLEPWLDHLVELGCNGLALGPVFASESHGYDTVDHFRIDPRLGDEADLVDLVGKASALGVQVVLDGVFNHVGRSFGPFADVVANGPGSPYASWFRPDGTGDFETFEGHGRLVALNHDAPEVAEHVTRVMRYWLDRGVAGWRLDAAYAVPLGFWRQVTDAVRVQHPDAWLVGEVIRGDFAEFVEQGGLDSVTQYELWKAIWSSLNDGNFFELAHALDRHDQLLETFLPQTFLGNHDVTRIASRLLDPRLLEHAVVILMTVGGIPSVYAGDEQAFRGVKEEREGGDDAVRPAFPADPGQLAGDGAATYRLHQLLIGLRRRNPWLVAAHSTTTTLTNTAIGYTVTDGTHRLAVALNVADEPVTLPLPSGGWRSVAGDGQVSDAGVELPARGWAVAVPG